MQGKITLITPPDFFENSNESVLFMHLTDEEQDVVSKWLSTNEVYTNINFYVYNGEPNMAWILYALSRCEHKYINFDSYNLITQALGGYMLGKNGIYYKTTDENLVAVYSHINQNRVENVEQFLKVIFGAKTI